MRRRRNPSFDIMGTALAAIGGAAMAGGVYALDGTDLSENVKAAIVGGGGLVVGGLVGGFSKAVGMGIAGAGVAFAAKTLLDKLLAGGGTQPQTSAIGPYAQAKYGMPWQRYYQMHAVGADLNAVGADLEGVQAWIG